MPFPHQAPLPNLGSVCHGNPQGSDLMPSTFVTGAQPDGDASAGRMQTIAAPMTPGLPAHSAMPASNTLDYWGRIYFNVVRDSMTEEHWHAINADPWQDLSAATDPPSIMAVWARLTFMQMREEQLNFVRGFPSP